MALFRPGNPRHIAILFSLLSALLFLIPLMLLFPGGAKALVIALIYGFVSFFVLHFLLKRYLDHQIKLIYKLISRTRASRREEFYYQEILPQKTIEEVSKDAEDWAEQRSTEMEMLRQNEAYRKEFLQNLSHELKTPIFSIQGYVETLLDGAGDNPERAQKFLTHASRNVDRLVKLVDDLDEISKLESGQLHLDYEKFVIQDLALEVFESLERKAAEKSIRLGIKKGCESPLTVWADREKIRQVLANLVDNAIKYGKPQGLTEASFYQVGGSSVLVEISDDGFGIAEEHLSRIFERFYRTDLARSRKVGGSGLGLSICKHIIEAHRHAIHVRSTIDVGTTFGFELSSNEK